MSAFEIAGSVFVLAALALSIGMAIYYSVSLWYMCLPSQVAKRREESRRWAEQMAEQMAEAIVNGLAAAIRAEIVSTVAEMGATAGRMAENTALLAEISAAKQPRDSDKRPS